jgi:hypothetical protein
MALSDFIYQSTGRSGSFSAGQHRHKTADSVEKVGHGFHGRKVRASD